MDLLREATGARQEPKDLNLELPLGLQLTVFSKHFPSLNLKKLTLFQALTPVALQTRALQCTVGFKACS